MPIMNKILEIQKTLEVEKTGWDERQEYAYFKADDVARSVRGKMNEVGLIHRTEILEWNEDNFYDSSGRNRPRITVKGRVTFIDPEDGSEFWTDAIATGSDTGGDKAARKYAVQLFKIAAIDLFIVTEEMEKFDSDGDKEAEPISTAEPKSATTAEMVAEIGALIKNPDIGVDAGIVSAVGNRIAREIIGKDFDEKAGWRKDARVLEAVLKALKNGEVE